LRGLLVISGVLLIYFSLPVFLSAYQVQKADDVLGKLRRNEDMTLAELTRGLDVLDRAVAYDPSAGRRLLRSELEAGSALFQHVKLEPDMKTALLQKARADLELGLTGAPASTVDWMQLASVRQALDGPSRNVIAPLMMSIQTGPWLEYLFYPRLRVIVDNWGYFTDEQKAEIQTYASGMWRNARNNRFFGNNISNPIDELIIRNLLRDEPGAQEKLTTWILTR
jgi:hypothetical protein